MVRCFKIVICRGPECGDRHGSAALHDVFRSALEANGAHAHTELVWQSCFGRCTQGPNVLVREILTETAPALGSGFATLPGPRGGQNDDGFYKISSDTGVSVFVVDLGSGTTFGPYPSGSTVKYTEANGATPNEKKIGSENGQSDAVIAHITGTGDMGVRTADSGVISCLVPPPPK